LWVAWRSGKENPHQPSAPGWWRLIKNKEVCETKQITNARGLYCKPDAKKKKTPIEYEPATDGGIKPGRASGTLPRGTEIKIT
jgi:hypothetical protein